MRVLFVGASSFGLRSLEAVYALPGFSVVGIVTNPKTFKISYSEKPVTNVLHADIVGWARDKSVPFFEMMRSMKDPDLFNWVSSLAPELIVVVGWYHMVPRSIRDIAPVVGLHASLLPNYSGGAPLVWAMINGERESGITLFLMDDGVDSGPILGQIREPILPDDTIGCLYSRIEEHGLYLLRQCLPALSAGTAKQVPQDESLRRVYPQRIPADGWIDWEQDVKAIDRFIRAQTRPYPGAFTSLQDGKRLTIWRARPSTDQRRSASATIYEAESSYCVQCANGSLVLLEVGFEGVTYGEADLRVLLQPEQRLGMAAPKDVLA